MRYQTILLLLGFLLCFSSFTFYKNDLLGVWSYHGEIRAYAKLKSMPEGPCFVFKKGGKLIVKQNAGWCGTPPISYANFDGTWKWNSDSTLLLKYKDWRGEAETEWVVTELTKHWLKMKPTPIKHRN